MNEKIQKIYPLTGLQTGIYYSKIKDVQSSNYHLQTEISVTLKLTQDQVRSTLDLLSYQYEVLRTAFVLPESTGEPKQVILADRMIPLIILEVKNENPRDVLEQYKTQDLRKGFDLQTDSLIRVAVLFSEDSTNFVFSTHHIILDGWSLNLLLNSFLAIIHQVSDGKSENEIKKYIDDEMSDVMDFSKYIKQTQSQNIEKAYEFWNEYLSNASTDSEIFTTTDEINREGKKETLTGSINKEMTEKLTLLAAKEGFTLNTIAEAAFGIVLQKYSYTDDVVFARVLSGREMALPNISKIFGLLIKSVPCRVKCQKDETFTALCKKMFADDLLVMEYSSVPLTVIQEHTGFRTDHIHAIVAFENYVDSNKSKQDGFEIVSAREEIDYPVSVSFFTSGDQLRFNLSCDGKKYSNNEMAVIGNVLQNILTYYAAHPDCQIGDIDFVDAYSEEIADRVRVLKNYDEAETLIQLLKEHVDSVPDQIAIEFHEKKVTYRELWEMAQRVAAELVRKQISAGQCVAISDEKCIEFIAAIYGIHMAGCACTVISDDFPLARQKLICMKTGAKIALYCSKKLEYDIPSICMDSDFWKESFEPVKEDLCKSQNIAHIIFTSGSSGEPKGVCLTHSNLAYFMHYNCVSDFDLDTNTVFMHISSQTFDASLIEIHGCLMHGGKLVIVEKDDFFDPDNAKKIISTHKINTCFLSTSLFNQMAEIDPTVFEELSIVGFGGEACNVNCINKVLEHNQNITLLNLYGPTETVCYVTCEKITRTRDKVTIGRPLPNTPVLILNGNKKCSVGMNGEICIIGPQVGAYLSDAATIQNRFVANPFGPGKMYRTGDVGRWRTDGKIEFLGRMDNQIKLRGYRIELNEIERALQSIQGITACAVKLFRKENDGVIVGYYSSNSKNNEDFIRGELSKMLPTYSVPAILVQQEKFELNEHGKIDKDKLELPEIRSNKNRKPPETEDQKRICDAAEEVLGKSDIGIDEDLFDIGMTSIKVIKLMAITKKYGYRFTVSDLYSYRTIECLCEHLIIKRAIEEFDTKHAKTVASLEELKAYLKEETEQYENELINKRDVSKEELLANQVRVSTQASVMSGVVIPFEEEFNIERLMQSVMHLLNRQSVLRTTFRNNMLIYKATYKDIRLPYISLKDASDELRRSAKEYFKTEYFRKTNIQAPERALHRMAAVKYSDTECELYFPIDHMIFDAMSGEIVTREILRYYYNPDAAEEEVLSYQEYGAQLALGPVYLESKNIADLLNLKEFASALKEYAKQDDSNFKNYVIDLSLGRSSDSFEQETLWNYAYKLFLKMVQFSIDVPRIPYVSVCINREYCEKKFYQTVGLFVDSLPFVDTVDANVDFKVMRERIKWLGKHNISAISMISNKKNMTKYIGVAVTMLSVVKFIPKVPIFNYLGIYSSASDPATGVDVAELLKNEQEIVRTVDVKVKQNGFSFLVFCKEGKNEELREYLQNILSEMIEEDSGKKGMV